MFFRFELFLFLCWCFVVSSIFATDTDTDIQFAGLPIPLPFPKECMPAVDMIDATGKVPSGIKYGNIVELGAFDQCLNIKQPVKNTDEIIKGKYCIMKIAIPKDNKLFTNEVNEFMVNFHPYMQTFNVDQKERGVINSLTPNETAGLLSGWCIPEKCDPNKFTNIFKPLGIEVKPALDGMLCQTEETKNKSLSDSDWGAVGFLIAILVIMITSTFYDTYLHFAKKRTAHLLFTAFSIKTNAAKLLSISNNPDQLSCVHGIRFISMMWVVLGHRYFIMVVQPIVNLLDVEKWAKTDASHMYIINAPVSVDTFFVLSGLLVGYGFCLAKDKGVRFNVLMYYIHRYLRLTPVLGAVVLIHATIIPYFGSGPFWPFAIFTLKDFCVKHWWAPLVYVQNYYNTQEMCVGQTWYLSVDFQLFILSPIILLPLWRWPKRTMIASAILVLGSIISSFVITYHYELPPFSLDPNKSQEYMDYYYITTHTRFGTWLMGLMLGYYIFRLKKDKGTRFTYKLHPSQVAFGWILSLTVMLACLFSSHSLLFENDVVSNSFWNGFHRHGWSLGVCWVIFACTQGYGGVINSFLSWSAFQVLGRFTYTIYLVHLSTQYLLAASSRTSHYFSDFNAMYMFWGDLFLSLGLAVCLTLAFESPMLIIEKVIFSFGKSNKQHPILPIHQQNGKNAPSTSALIKEDLNELSSTSERINGATNNAFESD